MKNRNIIAVPFSTDFHHCATTAEKKIKNPCAQRFVTDTEVVFSKWYEAMFLKSGIIWLSEKRKKKKKKAMNFKLKYLQYQ